MQLFIIIWKEIWLKSHECQWRKRKKRPQAELFNQIQYICHISYTNSVKVFAAASIWHVTRHTNILQKPQFCRTEATSPSACIHVYISSLEYIYIHLLLCFIATQCSIHLICQTIQVIEPRDGLVNWFKYFVIFFFLILTELSKHQTVDCDSDFRISKHQNHITWQTKQQKWMTCR